MNKFSVLKAHVKRRLEKAAIPALKYVAQDEVELELEQKANRAYSVWTQSRNSTNRLLEKEFVSKKDRERKINELDKYKEEYMKAFEKLNHYIENR